MSAYKDQAQQTYIAAHPIPLREGTRIPHISFVAKSSPKVMINGDIRLSVAAEHAALKPIRGSYRLNVENMQEPLQVIWITEGKVLHHAGPDIDMEFDLRGVSAGETRTYLLSAQITELDGQRTCVQSSVFVQISVIWEGSEG